MTENHLNKEYQNVMHRADQALGRKEVVSLLHKADSLRKLMNETDIDETIIHCSN